MSWEESTPGRIPVWLHVDPHLSVFSVTRGVTQKLHVKMLENQTCLQKIRSFSHLLLKIEKKILDFICSAETLKIWMCPIIKAHLLLRSHLICSSCHKLSPQLSQTVSQAVVAAYPQQLDLYLTQFSSDCLDKKIIKTQLRWQIENSIYWNVLFKQLLKLCNL